MSASLIFAVLLASYSAGLERVDDETRIDEYRILIRSWSQSIHTIQCRYQLTSTNYSPNDDHPVEQFSIEYKYDGENLLTHRVETGPDSQTKILQELLRGGEFSYKLYRSLRDDRIKNEVEYGRDGWPYPPRVFLMPHEFIQQVYSGRPLVDALNHGTSLLYESDQSVLFAHWSMGEEDSADFDIWIDKRSNTILSIDWVSRFGYSPGEMSKVWASQDLENARIPRVSFQFSDWTELSGVKIPLRVEERLFVLGPVLKELRDQVRAGVIGMDAYVGASLQERNDMEVMAEREVLIDADSLIVNEPIPIGEFVITTDVASLVLDRETGTAQLVVPWYRDPRTLAALLCAILLGIAIAAKTLRVTDKSPD